MSSRARRESWCVVAGQSFVTVTQIFDSNLSIGKTYCGGIGNANGGYQMQVATRHLRRRHSFLNGRSGSKRSHDVLAGCLRSCKLERVPRAHPPDREPVHIVPGGDHALDNERQERGWHLVPCPNRVHNDFASCGDFYSVEQYCENKICLFILKLLCGVCFLPEVLRVHDVDCSQDRSNRSECLHPRRNFGGLNRPAIERKYQAGNEQYSRASQNEKRSPLLASKFFHGAILT
jgi:hypothetical protein